METYAPTFSKVLSTNDPHYIPGYAGYCPQLKFNTGKSYSRLTAELLTSPDVKHSKRLVLQNDHIPTKECDTGLTLRNIPESNLKKTIPGYTGFIPKMQNYFACTFSEACHKASSECYQEKHAKSQQKSSDLRPNLPLTAISNKVFSYKPLKPFTPIGKPYSMDDDNPHKYFISGFTGHVPKSRFLIGKGYPIITNQALIQFGKQQKTDPTSKHTPEWKDSTITPITTNYPPNRGVVPSFAGHIPGLCQCLALRSAKLSKLLNKLPRVCFMFKACLTLHHPTGYRFMYGHNFGQLSQNALEKSGIKRIPQTKS